VADTNGDAGQSMDEEQLQAAVREFAGDVCSCCGAWHVRLPRRGWKLSVQGESVCSWRCAAHMTLDKGKLWRH